MFGDRFHLTSQPPSADEVSASFMYIIKLTWGLSLYVNLDLICGWYTQNEMPLRAVTVRSSSTSFTNVELNPYPIFNPRIFTTWTESFTLSASMPLWIEFDAYMISTLDASNSMTQFLLWSAFNGQKRFNRKWSWHRQSCLSLLNPIKRMELDRTVSWVCIIASKSKKSKVKTIISLDRYVTKPLPALQRK